jgi:hypothetical protein
VSPMGAFPYPSYTLFYIYTYFKKPIYCQTFVYIVDYLIKKKKDWLLKKPQYSLINLINELRFHPEDCHNYLRVNKETYFEFDT